MKRKTRDPIERFSEKYKISDGIFHNGEPCWIWIAAISCGYGYFQWGGVVGPAHRFSYELYSGKIPDGLHIDHLCRNRACVNPRHLEPVTQSENNKRACLRENLRSVIDINRSKTHCPHGHPYSGENLYIRVTGEVRRRVCRECSRNWARNNKKKR